MHRYPKSYDFYQNSHLAEETFINFSPQFDSFAAAGFYFSRGFLYCCGCPLRIRDWMDIKNPLIVHSILSPNCSFLLREKGPLFTHDVGHTYVRDWSADTFTCVICYARYIDSVLSCGHVYCSTCLRKLESCPLCKYPVSQYATNSAGIQFFWKTAEVVFER